LGPGVARTVRVHVDLARASAALARDLAEAAEDAVRRRGTFRWVISGGSTPLPLYRRLATHDRSAFPWKESEIFFADERCVSPRDPRSNFRGAWESLLAHVPVTRRRIHRLRGELSPATEAARRYARAIGPTGGSGDEPRFDVVLLGLGPDGHTASLFPSAPALRERRRPVVAVSRAGQPPFVPRLTMTLPALASSRQVWFLVSGAEKATVVAKTLAAGPAGSEALPASLVRSRGTVAWYLDRPAAADLGTTY
jgi:6-phosphogluconolactonase